MTRENCEERVPPAQRPVGYDPTDPYDGTNVEDLPDWWRRNVKHHREHGMRPYRPPRFRDDEPVPPTVAALERELSTDISLRGFATADGDTDWGIWVDGDRVASVDHYRAESGASRYELTAAEFRQIVTDAVES